MIRSRFVQMALLSLLLLVVACGPDTKETSDQQAATASVSSPAPSGESDSAASEETRQPQLSERITFTGFAYSIAYPAGWLVARRGPATVISQLAEDHEQAFQENPPPTRGIEVSLDHRSLEFMQNLGLAQEPTIQELFELNQAFFDWSDASPPERLEVFDAPALAVRAQGQGDWVYALMGFTNNEAFLLSVEAPGPQALDAFMPTWERMLASIEPAE
ncbi:MAG: hypothetical protein R3300_12750 [Candidatus Promineifilaceae bacterium]|nr:hypothetical protein [Candidatus Promineifilaceae bacterium]